MAPWCACWDKIPTWGHTGIFHLASPYCLLKRLFYLIHLNTFEYGTSLRRTAGVPSYLWPQGTPHIPAKALGSQNASILTILRINKTSAGGRSFSDTVPVCWNHLPIHIWKTSSVDSLKSKPKHIYLNLPLIFLSLPKYWTRLLTSLYSLYVLFYVLMLHIFCMCVSFFSVHIVYCCIFNYLTIVPPFL